MLYPRLAFAHDWAVGRATHISSGATVSVYVNRHRRIVDAWLVNLIYESGAFESFRVSGRTVWDALDNVDRRIKPRGYTRVNESPAGPARLCAGPSL